MRIKGERKTMKTYIKHKSNKTKRHKPIKANKQKNNTPHEDKIKQTNARAKDNNYNNKK